MTEAGPLMETSLTSRGETYRIAVLYGPEIEVVSPLLLEVFGPRGFTPDWVRRKYACERDGARAFACVAFAADGRPVAVVGALPWPMRYGERRELATQLADCATSPAHQGRGLHVRLVELVHEVSAAAGMTFVFRFSNDLSFAITTSKLGYTPLDELAEYNWPVRTVWAERVARRIGQGAAYDRHVERVTHPLLDAEPPLASTVLAEGHAGVDRDRAFFDYKEAFGGSRVVNLDGARVWLTVRHGLQVGDMDADTDEELGRGLDALTRLARRLGVHRLLFQAAPDIRLSRFLATRLPQTRTRHISCFDLSSKIPSHSLRFTFGDIDTF
jgi:predicted N-acetyltransferase YhbS